MRFLARFLPKFMIFAVEKIFLFVEVVLNRWNPPGQATRNNRNETALSGHLKIVVDVFNEFRLTSDAGKPNSRKNPVVLITSPKEVYDSRLRDIFHVLVPGFYCNSLGIKMYYFSGIVSIVVAVTLLHGMTNVWPKRDYEQIVKQIVK